MAGPVLDEVPAVPAASAIVLRDAPLEVLMLRRTASASFMPNAWVFPGGMTEPQDRELAASELDAMRITAVRETFEESGVWLGAHLLDAESKRARLQAGELSLRELLAEAPVTPGSLVYTSRWITPVGVPKRFDTWFFLAVVSRDAIASAEQREATAAQWVQPQDALSRHAAREMQMVFPTLRNLEALVGFDSARALLASRRDATIEPVLPLLVDGKPTLPRAREADLAAMNIRPITAPNPGPYTLDGTKTYLIGETAVVDPGPWIESHVEAIHAAMPRLQTILITHRHGDHAPAAVPLKERTGARIIAPRNVLDDAVVDQRVSGGETIGIEGVTVEVIATPGHTSEHVCYLTADGELFTGDTILGYGTTAVFPPDGNMSDYMRSLEVLRTRAPRRILPAHGPIRDDAMPLIEHYIAHRRERERQVHEALHAGATTPAEMRARIYPQLDAALHGAAEIQIGAHLEKLRAEGRA